MIENIPSSVLLSIKAAAKDVASSVKGGAYNPIATDKLANTLEKFMISMVAQSYPKVKSAWIDQDVNPSWVKVAGQGMLVDDEKLLKSMEKWKSMMSSDNYDMLVRNTFSKFHGKELSHLQKEDPQLYKDYMGIVNGPSLMDTSLDTSAPSEPVVPKSVPEHPKHEPDHKKEDEIAPPKQKLMQPGQVRHNPVDDEFEKGVPPTTII